MLEAVGVATDQLEFVLGSSYQTSSAYVMDVYKLCSLTSEHDAKKAGAEIVKQSDNSPLSTFSVLCTFAGRIRSGANKWSRWAALPSFADS